MGITFIWDKFSAILKSCPQNLNRTFHVLFSSPRLQKLELPSERLPFRYPLRIGSDRARCRRQPPEPRRGALAPRGSARGTRGRRCALRTQAAHIPAHIRKYNGEPVTEGLLEQTITFGIYKFQFGTHGTLSYAILYKCVYMYIPFLCVCLTSI